MPSLKPIGTLILKNSTLGSSLSVPANSPSASVLGSDKL